MTTLLLVCDGTLHIAGDPEFAALPTHDKLFRCHRNVMSPFAQLRRSRKENATAHWFVAHRKQFVIYTVGHNCCAFAWQSKIVNQIIAHPFRRADGEICIQGRKRLSIESAADRSIVGYIKFPTGELLSFLPQYPLGAQRDIN